MLRDRGVTGKYVAIMELPVRVPSGLHGVRVSQDMMG